MSTELESLVRPFQTNEITPSQTYYNFGDIGVQNVVLQLGRGGSGKTMTGSYSYSASFYVEQNHVQIESDVNLGEGGGGDPSRGNY